MNMRLSCICCLLALGVLNAAEEAEAILNSARKSVPPAAWADLGSQVWPKSIEAAWKAHPNLPVADQNILRIALAEAWLAAGVVPQAKTYLDAVARDALDDAQRDRFANAALLLWREEWARTEDQTTVVSAPKIIRELGKVSDTLRARAHVAEAARLIATDQAKKSLVQYDAAYRLLKTASLDERVTILQLRLTAMEAAGIRQASIIDWFNQRKKDPAVKAMSGAMFSEQQSLLGQKVPTQFTMPMSEASGEMVSHPFKTPLRVLFVFATWSKGSKDSAPLLAAAQKEFADKINILGISIDTAESAKHIAPFLQASGLEIPVLQQHKAWESEVIKQLRVEAVPSIILIDKQGVVYATDIHGVDAQQTKARLAESIDQALKGAPAGAAPAPDHPAEEEDIP